MRCLISYLRTVRSIALQAEVTDRIRMQCFCGLMRAEWRWLSRGREADNTALMVSTIGRLNLGFNNALQLAATVILSAAYLAVALVLSWKMTLVAVVFGCLAGLGFSEYQARTMRAGHDVNRANEKMHRHASEGVASIRLTKSLGNETRQIAAFRDAVARMRRPQQEFFRNAGLTSAILQFSATVLLAMIFYAGLVPLHLPLAVILPLALVFWRLVPMLRAIQESWHQWLYAVPAFQEVEKLIAETARNAEPSFGHAPPPVLHHALSFTGVTVRYQDRQVCALEDVTFQIAANTTIAITGASGSGKSTLADVIMGLMKPDGGVFAVDGVAITDANRLGWRKSIGYVEQNAIFLPGSIRDNLLWSKPEASEVEISNALAQAAANFVFRLPGGLDCEMGDGGVRLSGGERQRIALARTLLQKPSVLILDEATSALDSVNEDAIRRAVDGLRGKATVIIIGHRGALLDDVDQVVAIHDGRILRDMHVQSGRTVPA